MGTPVFLFSEIIEATSLGLSRVRWREISRIYPEDNQDGLLIQEYESMEDYYDPIAEIVISDPVTVVLTGGFNRGDSLGLTVQSTLAGSSVASLVDLVSVSASDAAASILADKIRLDSGDVVLIQQDLMNEQGQTTLHFAPIEEGDTIVVSLPVVTRSTIVIPPEMEEFIVAIEGLG